MKDPLETLESMVLCLMSVVLIYVVVAVALR
jgi:hypothetical protein